MTDQGDGYILSTGRRFSANCGLLSITEDGKLCEGYDGIVRIETDDDDDVYGQSALTAEERREIAAAMIERWQRWAAVGATRREEG